MTMRVLPLLAPMMVAAAGPAAAHHSLAMYDHTRTVSLEGRVAEFKFVQPHPYLVLTAKDGAWRLEMDNLGELKQAGMTHYTFQPGDKVTVSGDPQRDGSRNLYLRRLDRPGDGLIYEQPDQDPRLTKRR